MKNRIVVALMAVLCVLIATSILVAPSISQAQAPTIYQYRSVTSDTIGLASPGWESESLKLTEVFGKEGWRFLGADWVTTGFTCSSSQGSQQCQYSGYRVYHFVMP